jgi:hypothetical protein
MNRNKKWILGLAGAAVVALGGFGARSLVARDDDGAAKKAAQEAAVKAERAQMRAKRIAAFKKLFPASKTSLAAAVKAVEEANPQARAYEVSFGLDKNSALTIEVGLLVGDQFASAMVDPQTGKPSTIRQGDDDDDDDGDDDDDDDGDDDDDDDDVDEDD